MIHNNMRERDFWNYLNSNQKSKAQKKNFLLRNVKKRHIMAGNYGEVFGGEQYGYTTKWRNGEKYMKVNFYDRNNIINSQVSRGSKITFKFGSKAHRILMNRGIFPVEEGFKRTGRGIEAVQYPQLNQNIHGLPHDNFLYGKLYLYLYLGLVLCMFGLFFLRNL